MGTPLGFTVGAEVGFPVGAKVGFPVGVSDGTIESVGDTDGKCDGDADGRSDVSDLGSAFVTSGGISGLLTNSLFDCILASFSTTAVLSCCNVTTSVASEMTFAKICCVAAGGGSGAVSPPVASLWITVADTLSCFS